MHILIAPDKFRGSLTADQVCRAASEGALLALPAAMVTAVPLADGGEGILQLLTESTGASYINLTVQNPLGRAISTQYAISSDGKTAFIEMASASGLHLLDESERNPMFTSTFGTGQQIRDALLRGVEKILIGIGGSATNDAGIGMAAALGFQFFDEKDRELEPVGGNLLLIRRIGRSDLTGQLECVAFEIACDVDNPLFGHQGAAAIYAAQKGASEQEIIQLDSGLRQFAAVATNSFGRDFSSLPGAGAAGGFGAGAKWFLNAQLYSGAQVVLQYLGVDRLIQQADLVISGEGKVDHQTLNGKLLKGLALACKSYNKPLAIICGTLDITPEQSLELGLTYATSILTRPQSLAEAQSEAYDRVREAAFYLVNLFKT